MCLSTQQNDVSPHESGFDDPDVAAKLAEIHEKFVVAPADKVSNNIVFVCKTHYINCLMEELGMSTMTGNPTFNLTPWTCLLPFYCYVQGRNSTNKKVREKSRECHNHKKGKRKVHEVPQSQTAALPRHQEEEETDKTSANRTNVRKALRLALSTQSEVIAMLKGLKNTGTK